jgi:putative hydrolase of the HAD superfamily
MMPVAAVFSSGSPLGCCLHDWNVTPHERADGRRASRGLVLDLDDTLYPREQFVHSGLMAVARHVQDVRGVPAMDAFAVMAEARRQGLAGRELQALCAAFGIPEESLESLVEVVRRHRPLLRLPKDSVRTLVALRAAGWRMVVLTNGLPRVQRAKVLSLGLRAFVDDVIYAEEEADGGKPAAAAFRAALSKLALPARSCVCVGDDPACDIAGASAMGLATILVGRGSDVGRASDVGRGFSPADLQITSLAQLPAALAQLERRVDSDAA